MTGELFPASHPCLIIKWTFFSIVELPEGPKKLRSDALVVENDRFDHELNQI